MVGDTARSTAVQEPRTGQLKPLCRQPWPVGFSCAPCAPPPACSWPSDDCPMGPRCVLTAGVASGQGAAPRKQPVPLQGAAEVGAAFCIEMSLWAGGGLGAAPGTRLCILSLSHLAHNLCLVTSTCSCSGGSRVSFARQTPRSPLCPASLPQSACPAPRPGQAAAGSWGTPARSSAYLSLPDGLPGN